MAAARTLAVLLVVAIAVLGCSNAHQFHSRLEKINVVSIVHLEGTTPSSLPVTISADKATLFGTRELVSVAWSGVDAPTPNDWIAVYSPSNVNYSTTAPIKYKFAQASKTHLSTGAGSLSFDISNMRGDYAFVFYRNGIDKPVLAGLSPPVAFDNYNEPTQIRLALGLAPGSLTVSWSTRDAAAPVAKWGLSPQKYVHSAPAVTSTYERTEMCGGSASGVGWRDPGLTHTVVLDGLQASARYYYVVGDDKFGFSAERYFDAPPISRADHETDIIAYGDMGKEEDDGSTSWNWNEPPSINTTDRVIAELDATQLVLHIGDISYAVGYSAQWDVFFDMVEPVASRVPYMVGVGNHERDMPNSGSYYNGTDSGGECGVPYNHRLVMPREEGSGEDVAWYDFTFGNMHHIIMSTEHSFVRGSKQYDFIAKALTRTDRTKTPWVIFSGHRPMYIDSTNEDAPDGDQPVARLLRQHIEPMMLAAKVDLALWGHHHSYQRTCPVSMEACAANATGHTSKAIAGNPFFGEVYSGGYAAPIHCVIGMGGMSHSQNLRPTKPAWALVVNDDKYGYTRIRANATTLYMQFVGNVDGKLLDEFTIVKPAA